MEVVGWLHMATTKPYYEIMLRKIASYQFQSRVVVKFFADGTGGTIPKETSGAFSDEMRTTIPDETRWALSNETSKPLPGETS